MSNQLLPFEEKIAPGLPYASYAVEFFSHSIFVFKSKVLWPFY